MQETLYYVGGFAAFLALVLILEWNKIRRADTQKILTILIVIFFVGSTLAYLFL